MSTKQRTLANGETGELGLAGGDSSRQRIAATGGILGAIGASACCILPLVLTVFGITGAWMANLRALAPYQPIFIGLTAAFLGYGFYLVYAKPRHACTDDAVCADPVVPGKVVQAALWLATIIVILAVSFPYWFPSIVPYLP